jgi:hypothetical protein
MVTGPAMGKNTRWGGAGRFDVMGIYPANQ